MSHELRTPLNAVIGFSEVLLERMFGELNERQEDYLQDILDAGRHLLALLNDVLDLARSRRAAWSSTARPSRPPTPSTTCSPWCANGANQHGSICTSTPRSAGLVTRRRAALQAGAAQPLSNAVKFTPDGRHASTVRAVDGGPELSSPSPTPEWESRRADQERIFDSFQQGSAPRRRLEGTGLGLTLTRADRGAARRTDVARQRGRPRQHLRLHDPRQVPRRDQ